MKDSRFIELLNLYVDHQLTGQEAAELEGEIAKNPGRRKTYQQYCRMQNACTRLFESECTLAPASSALTRALAEADRKIVAFPNRRPLWPRGVTVVGFAAVAACVVFVALPRQAQRSQDTASVVMPERMELASSTAVSTPSPVASKPASGRAEFYPVFSPRKIAGVVDAAEAEPASEQSEKANLDWMRRVDLQPLRPVFADRFAFDPHQTLPRESTDLNNRRTNQNSSVEKTVFMFQR